MKLVVCETTAAITTHIRRVESDEEIRLSGHSTRPLALCKAAISWDTRLPLEAARCRECRAVAGLPPLAR